jgi:hypothetical protein
MQQQPKSPDLNLNQVETLPNLSSQKKINDKIPLGVKRASVLLALGLTLSSCGEKSKNTSSELNQQSSTEQVTSKLDESKTCNDPTIASYINLTKNAENLDFAVKKKYLAHGESQVRKNRGHFSPLGKDYVIVDINESKPTKAFVNIIDKNFVQTHNAGDLITSESLKEIKCTIPLEE